MMLYEFRPLVRWDGPETSPRKGSHIFLATWPDTLSLLEYEIDCLDGLFKPVVIQVDADESMIRQDGMLYARARVGHPGVAISFESKFGPLRYATDAYEQQYSGARPGWQANVRAIALALNALRAVDRYGVTRRGEQYTGWRAIARPAPLFISVEDAGDWMRHYAALHFDLTGNDSGWKALYRAMAKRMHPDQGGPRADWDRLEAAHRMLAEAGWL